MAENEKPKILIVDDDPENIHALMGTLSTDYSIVAATSGEKALALANSTKDLDLILLDILMPGMDGFEVCARLKQEPGLSEVPVIFVSALRDTEDKVRGLGLGGQDFITKPFQYEEVHARVRTHISLYHLQRELQQKNRRLEELEKLKNNLTQMIVHDLRSPLTGAMGFLELASNEPSEELGPEAAHCLDRAHTCMLQIKEMVDQLLDVARLEENRMPMQPEVNDLEELGKRALNQVESLVGDREVRISRSGPALLECDGALVQRVFQNLIANALKFSPPGTAILVVIEGGEQFVRASVQDQGRGIPETGRERIFDKFFQHQKGDQRMGVGLGLTFCKLAIEAHGGAIGVDSSPMGGATFWFELPAAPDIG